VKKETKNIAASVRAKLQNRGKETNRPFAELLQYYSMERFLYRLSKSEYAEKFILKGALMFTVWDVPQRRTTLDIDFLSKSSLDPAKLEKVIREVCQVNVPDDGLFFDADTVIGERIKENADYEGVRIKFKGFLERARIPMQIDIAFGDVIYPKPGLIHYPVILDLPEPHLMGYTYESVVAEKFEAMIKLGDSNSRMKDFYDVWLLSRKFDFVGTDLSEAIRKTFKRRKTALPKKIPLFSKDIYDQNSDRQTLWKSFLKKTNTKNTLETLNEIALSIENFLASPIIAIHTGQNFTFKWKAPGPWK
jgi:hypothetical protein